MELSGKIALITGGARMGADIALALAKRGTKIALLYRASRKAAEETIKSIEKAKGTAIAIRGDVISEQDCRRAAADVARKFGGLDILVNMASSYERRGLKQLTAEDWERAMGVDARGSYLMSLAAAPFMKKRGAGRIINFSDWVAASGRPRYDSYLSYYTAKSAVLGLTQALALELAPAILVNAIAPGPILPPPGMSLMERRKVINSTPLARWGGPAEIAKAVLFLVDSDFVTGECIRVDGGRHLR
ncbi:SDR family oxidoreductase [Candidatus Sumerlaeota bacterium]|nr:SDR family oxidoreductase [Candidatus Sumerlaeota bacterium]